MTSQSEEAASVNRYWRDSETHWFAKDPEFDADFRRRFLALHRSVAAGMHEDWIEQAEPALALIILTDQFPRNAFRGTDQMYKTDGLARGYAREAIARGHPERIGSDLRLFCFLPFTHSEDQADQDLSVTLIAGLGEPSLSHATRHRDIIRRFGRFPHRNVILGRSSTQAELDFLADGGFAG